MDTQRKASIQRPLRFTPDENAELVAFLDASGQGYQAWAHDSLLSLARTGTEIGAELEPRQQTPIRDRQAAVVKARRSDVAVGAAPRGTVPAAPPAPRFTQRPKAAAAAPTEPKPAAPSAEPSSGWTRPPGGW